MSYKITPWFSGTCFSIPDFCCSLLSFFRSRQGRNETEKQLLDLMYNCKMDMGAGSHRSTGQIFIPQAFALR
jgi:hypothetical protein